MSEVYTGQNTDKGCCHHNACGQRGYCMINRIEELEAKLAWAVGELEEMLMFQNSEAAYGILRVYTKALLAELKGQDDE